MFNYKYITILLITSLSRLICQPHQDARMLGLNGSYTTLATGYQAVGINPANLGIYKNYSVNVFDLSIGLSNNFFSVTNYNAINGAHLEDSLSFNYYPKEIFYESFGGKGIRILQSFRLPFPIFNFSTPKFAITTNFSNNIDFGMPNGVIDLLFYGNPIGKDISIDLEQFITMTQETGFSYGHNFSGFSAGFTIKYILGLFYMGMESLYNPSIVTDITGFTGKNQYLIQQAIGGTGVGLDIGITSNESEEGYSFGISIINLLGTIKWTQKNFIREKLEATLSNAGDFYLRPNEYIYINFVMDSVSAGSFSEKSDDPLIYYEKYKVIPLSNIDSLNLSGSDSSLITQFYNNTFLIPSGGDYKLTALVGGDGDKEYLISDNYVKYSEGDSNPFKTRQPIYIRFGVSKHWIDQAIVAADLVTGFSNRLGSSSSWRLSIGAEIIRFNGKLLRLGYAFGGVAKQSMSFGYGFNIGAIRLDLGLALNGGMKLDYAKGFDFAFGIFWQPR